MSFSQVTKLLAVAAAAQAVTAHSWVESIRQISSTGAFIGGEGFPRGFVSQSAPGFVDTMMTNKILVQDSTTSMCLGSQQPGDYTAQYPRLTVAAGGKAAMIYQENGHVTAPQLPVGRPFRSGNVFIYATTEPKANEKFLDVHGTWTPDGTGGDQRGKLIASHFFDDGECFQDRASNPTSISKARVAATGLSALYCQTDFQIPQELQAGDNLTLYWVWDWPLFANQIGQANETYTTCSEVTIGTSSNSTSITEKLVSVETVLPSSGISSQLATPFEVFALGTGTASPPAPTEFATTGIASGANATASGAKATASSKKGHPGVKTITVTADVETVTEYKTITVDAAGGVQQGTTTTAAAAVAVTSASVSATATASTLKTSTKTRSSGTTEITGLVSVTTVTPFLKARVTGQARRAL